MYYAHKECVLFFLTQIFTSHQGRRQSPATTHITYSTRYTHEPCKVEQVVSCCWPKTYKHAVGRFLHQQTRQHSISFSIKYHIPIYGKESYSQRAPSGFKSSSLIFLALQLAHGSLGGGPQLKTDGEVVQQWQDSNKFASPLLCDKREHAAYGTCFQLLALVGRTAKTVSVRLHVLATGNPQQSIWGFDQYLCSTCVGISVHLSSTQKS